MKAVPKFEPIEKCSKNYFVHKTKKTTTLNPTSNYIQKYNLQCRIICEIKIFFYTYLGYNIEYQSWMPTEIRAGESKKEDTVFLLGLLFVYALQRLVKKEIKEVKLLDYYAIFDYRLIIEDVISTTKNRT